MISKCMPEASKSAIVPKLHSKAPSPQLKDAQIITASQVGTTWLTCRAARVDMPVFGPTVDDERSIRNNHSLTTVSSRPFLPACCWDTELQQFLGIWLKESY
jgi:hypothetical protein